MSSSPQISSAIPISGSLSGGTQVDISGSGLINTSSILFGVVPATEFEVLNDTMIFVITPPGTSVGEVPITVVTPNGISVPSSTSQFTYIQVTPPSIASVFPAFGAQSGGTQVTITGSDLSGATAVNFGGIPATEFVANSDNSILVTLPAGTAPGIVPVTVTTPSGISASDPAANFTFLPPQQTGASQSGGSASGSSSGGSSSAQGGSSQGGSAAGGSTSPGSSSSAGSSQSGSGQGGSSQGGSSQTGSSSSSQGGSSQGGSSTVGASQGSSQTGGASSSGQGSSSSNSGSGPAPGNFIPGGLGPVPGGLTGLGGTAGTGAGFGVGTLLPGGGGSAPPSNLPYYVDPSLTAQLVQSLMGLVQNAASPDALEAQNLILRRMALEGDVVGSRMPPPRNISEIGGYLNLLGTLKEKAMREQALAGILGVAGPVNALGWVSNVQPLSMVAVTNDRPPVAAQSSFPLTVLIRSDFVGPFQAALKTLHSYGATLPLTSPSVILLPAGGTGAVVPPAPAILYFLGRAISIAPSAALAVPGADPIALVSAASAGPFQLASNVLNPPTAPVPAPSQASGDVFTVVCSPTSQTVFQLSTSPYILIAPTLAAAGYYPLFPMPVPANSTIHTWAWLTNTTGLVAGTTELGDELSMLYPQSQIASSVFASMLSWTWNGSIFAP
ncbi:MAG: IPT/TIG domain-containing protein [Terriglobales bacterium]